MYKEILDIYLNSYENKVQNMYSHISEHHKEAFPVLKFKEYLNVSHFKVNRDMFGSKDYLVIFDHAEHLSQEYIFDEVDESLSKILVDEYKHKRFNKLLEVKYPEFFERNLAIIVELGGGLYRTSGSLADSSIELAAKGQVEKDYRSWNKENKTIVSRYRHDKISSHSHLDYDTLIKKFKSDIFEKDFEYQMNQAEECYKRHLYLPAAATLSVALETVLADLCKKEKIKIKNSTEMNHLGEKLVERGILNYRLGKRIDITYSLRNSLAHTNRGEVSKDDCSIILSCIRTIIEEHY